MRGKTSNTVGYPTVLGLSTAERLANCKKHFYSSESSYLNALNYIMDYPSKPFDKICDFFMSHTNSLITFVSKVSNKNLEFINKSKDRIKDLLEFLSQDNKSFSSKNFNNFAEPEDCICFCKILFDIYYFSNENIKLMINQCNAIFEDYQLEIKDFDKFLENNGIYFLPLLQRLIYKQKNIINQKIYPPFEKFSIKRLHELFKSSNVDFILTDSSFSKYDKSIIALQTKIILDQFDKEYLNNLIQKNKSTKLTCNSPLLLSMNAIFSKFGLKFDSIEMISDVKLLQCFIEILLDNNLESIVPHSEIHSEEESNENFESIIDYLIQEKKIFKVLLFDFKDPEKKESSSILLLQSLFDHFFIRENKERLLKRCDDLIGFVTPIKTVNDFKEINTFVYLLDFLLDGKLHWLQKDKSKASYQDLIFKFKQAKVPLVINEDCIKEPEKNERYFYYQLQFYFDRLDYEIEMSRKWLFVVEKMYNSFTKITKLNKIDIKKITEKIKANQALSKYKLENSKNEKMKQDLIHSFLVSKKKGEHYLLNTSIIELKKFKIEKEFNIDNKEDYVKKNIDSIGFWNINHVFMTQYSFYNGLINVNFQKEIEIDLLYKIKNDLDSFKLKEALLYPPIQSTNQHKLYKIFYFDEKKYKWTFNHIAFNLFTKDFNLNSLNTYLVLFFNSFFDELIDFNMNFIDGIYPPEEDDQIYVYALFYKCFINSKDDAKPIFLVPHVPKHKKIPQIELIMMQIYVYLYSISTVQIILLSRMQNFYAQLNSAKFIYEISKGLNIRLNLDTKLLLIQKDDRFIQENEHLIIKGDFYNIMKNLLPTMSLFPLNFNSNSDRLRNCLNNLTKTSKFFTFYDLSLKIKQFNFYEISNAYIQFKMMEITNKITKNSGIDLDNLIQRIINERKNQLCHYQGDHNLTLFNEFACFAPETDLKFVSRYQTILFSSLKDSKESIQITLEKELVKQAKSLFKNLENIVKHEVYLSKKEKTLIINTYMKHLDEAFYDCIFVSGYGRIADFLYRNKSYNEILEKQKKDDYNKIQVLFNKFSRSTKKKYGEEAKEDKILKDDVVVEHFGKTKGYVINEVENMKNIDVIVEVGQNIEDKIEQDF
ncbi:hypothetical protein M9Y10_031683 [Tritrichomonas musculus]|uniref:Uncharacterized protein n=1 Tax=Tritrichomonas musculus TaxID=1915356 RepID=A0ABR2H2F7_9EUKA